MGFFDKSAGVDCIVSAADIAKLEFAFAGDVIASLVFFHDHIASPAFPKEVILF